MGFPPNGAHRSLSLLHVLEDGASDEIAVVGVSKASSESRASHLQQAKVITSRTGVATSPYWIAPDWRAARANAMQLSKWSTPACFR